MITPDRLVALVGLLMALVLVSRNGALRGVTLSAKVQMALIWAVVIALTALFYDWATRH